MMFDSRSFRDTLGAFATGVTVITARSESGGDVGITVNSFSAVSLEPPLVLWSLGRDAQSFDSFVAAEHFVIHVLAEDQQALSNHFATKSNDKFTGLALERGDTGIALLQGCAARFDCKTAFRYEGGDHVIIVGEVFHIENTALPPLVFHRGSYHRLATDCC